MSTARTSTRTVSRAAVRTQRHAPTPSADLEATGRLRDAITSGTFHPNERLVESDLGEYLGTSRGSVRVVLARLEQEGLVVRERHRGARVRLISEADAVEIIEARCGLESVVARHAAVNATPATTAELRAVLAKLRALGKAGDLLAYSDANRELHAVILRMSKHQTATMLLGILKSQSVSFQYRSILQPGRPGRSIREHEALVEAIVARDPDRAEAAMRDHLNGALAALKAAIAARTAPR